MSEPEPEPEPDPEIETGGARASGPASEDGEDMLGFNLFESCAARRTEEFDFGPGLQLSIVCLDDEPIGVQVPPPLPLWAIPLQKLCRRHLLFLCGWGASCVSAVWSAALAGSPGSMPPHCFSLGLSSQQYGSRAWSGLR